MLTDIITLLQTHHFKGAGKYTEIAKGKNELGNNRRKLKRKIAELWHNKKK